MQILHWLLKEKHDEHERESSTFCSPPSKREAINNKNAKWKDVILKHLRENRRTKRKEGTKLDRKKLKLFAFSSICGKDNIPKTCYYSTLNVHSLNMKGEELSQGVGSTKKADSSTRVRNKVLPITEATFSTSTEGKYQCGTRKTKYQTKGNKKKAISRMKELQRWAIATKTDESREFNEHKVLRLQRCRTTKPVPDDDQLSSESPKISFTLDVESCSLTSVYSAISIAPLCNNGQAQIAHSSIYIPPEDSGHMISRKGNWITTEDFVVLEL